MRSEDDIWIGIDPGGEGNFAVAILRAGGRCETWSVSYVEAAIDSICKRLGKSTPLGVGVDSPLWWCSGRAGLRRADQTIRDEYDLAPKNVQAVNSLWGAVLAQGMMTVARLRDVFPEIQVTETHPKAVLTVLGRSQWASYFEIAQVDVAVDSNPDHRRDAAISAIAAREGFQGRWTRNFAEEPRHPTEQDPQSHWLSPIEYFWPGPDIAPVRRPT